MVISAHWIKVVVRTTKAMANECLDRIASATENKCKPVSKTDVNDALEGDGAFAPLIVTEQVTIQGGYLKHPAVVCCQRVNGYCFVLISAIGSARLLLAGAVADHF